MKRIAIMQPYFLPYIGYFQLMNAVDEFVVYDNIQFTKKGWIHRNRMLQNGKDEYLSLPLKKDSDFLNIDQRFLADTFSQERLKMLSKIDNNYRKSSFFNRAYPIVKEIFESNNPNLFEFIYNSLLLIKDYLGISTPFKISSHIEIDDQLKGKDRVVAIVQALNGTHYINPIGGQALYDKDEFAQRGIELSFLKTKDFIYKQYANEFVPFLSILDVMMFNDKNEITNLLLQFNTI